MSTTDETEKKTTKTKAQSQAAESQSLQPGAASKEQIAEYIELGRKYLEHMIGSDRASGGIALIDVPADLYGDHVKQLVDKRQSVNSKPNIATAEEKAKALANAKLEIFKAVQEAVGVWQEQMTSAAHAEDTNHAAVTVDQDNQ